MKWHWWGKPKPPPKDGEFTEETAMTMASLLYMIDERNFSRVGSGDDVPEFEIRREPRAQANNVMSANLKLESAASDRLASETLSQCARAGITNPPVATREGTETLLGDLQSAHGAEGAKRYAERAYILHRDRREPEWAMLWANLRTMMDVERLTKVGGPFIVEHYLGDLFVVNDRNGARIEHFGGAAMKLQARSSSYRDKLEY